MHDLTDDPDVDIFLEYDSYKIFAVLQIEDMKVLERLPWGIGDWPSEQRHKYLEKVAERLIKRCLSN